MNSSLTSSCSLRSLCELYHAVHPQPDCGARYSIIFRTVHTHVAIDKETQARANGDDHRFTKKRKRAGAGSILPFLAPSLRK